MPFEKGVFQNSQAAFRLGLERLAAGETLKLVGLRWMWEGTHECFPDGTINSLFRRGLAAMRDTRTIVVTRAGRRWLAAHEPSQEAA